MQKSKRTTGWILMSLMWVGCADGQGDDPVPDVVSAVVEDGEWLPGGETTNTLLLGSNAFLRPAENLSPEDEPLFYSGNSFFNDSWVQAPSSTANRDGLGPLFNARGCSGCHFKDGRAAPPDEGGKGPFVGLLFRLSGPDGLPEPTYGGQLQDQANPDVAPEFLPNLQWVIVDGTYDDGTAYSLSKPVYTFTDFSLGPMVDGALFSP